MTASTKSYTKYELSGTAQSRFPFDFPYFNVSDITVELPPDYAGTYTINASTHTVELSSPISVGTILIRRHTPQAVKHIFANMMRFNFKAVDENFKQCLYWFQEALDSIDFTSAGATAIRINEVEAEAASWVAAEGAARDTAISNERAAWQQGDTSLAQQITTNLASSTGAALVGFLQSGVGAANRSLQDKLREAVSVNDFIPAEVNTATTDCTAYIQAAFNSGAAVVSFEQGKTYICNNVRIPFLTNRIIYGNGATLKNTSTTGVNNCSLLYSNCLNPGDATRTAGDGNTLTIYNLNFDGLGNGVGLRYIVANHLWMYNCRTQNLTEGVRVGSCNDIHFENCMLGGTTGLHCILKADDPYSESFSEVSFNDGIYINGGMLVGTQYGVKYDGSLAEGVLIVRDAIIALSSNSGVYAKDFYSVIVEGCWTEFFPSGSRQINLVSNGSGYEPFEAIVRGNFFTCYNHLGIAGNVPDYIIYSNCQHLKVEDNYFQFQQMPAQKCIYHSCGANYSVPTRTNITITHTNTGSDFMVCEVMNTGSNSMILSELELQGIITDSAGKEFYARVAQTLSDRYQLVYYTATPVYRKAANIRANQYSSVEFDSDESFTISLPSAPLTNGIGSYTPMASAITGSWCVIDMNTFMYPASPVNRQTLFGKFYGNFSVTPRNAYREV